MECPACDTANDLSAIHVLSHGAEGSLDLGSSTLGSDTLDVYSDVAAKLGLKTHTEAAPPLLAGLVSPGDEAGSDLLVRNVVGFDASRKSFSIPEPIASGQRLALVVLDGDSARTGFASQLDEFRGESPTFGLYFNCRARGASLFGEVGVEAEYLANAFADLPIGGVIGPYQIAPTPLRPDPVVLTYAGALALVIEAE